MSIRQYHKVFDASWPADLGPSHSDRLTFTPKGERGNFEVRHTGRGLPAPFHRGLALSWFGKDMKSYRKTHVAKDDVEALADILRNPGAYARQVMTVSDRLHGHADHSGMTCGMVMPVGIGTGWRGATTIKCQVEVSALDDAGNPVTDLHTLCDYALDKSGWREIARLANRQEERRALSGRRLVADPVTAGAIARMLDRDRARLLEHLRARPQTTPHEAGTQTPNWTEETLSPLGLRLPPGMETIYVRDGRIIGRVRIGERTTWNAGRLLHRGDALAQTVIAALPGMPIGSLIEDERLSSDMTIAAIRMDGFGAIRAEISSTIAEVL